MTDQVKDGVDLGALGVIIAVAMGWLPQLAALISTLWLIVRLYNEVQKAIYYRHRRKLQRERRNNGPL